MAIRTVLAVGARYSDYMPLHARDEAILEFAFACAREVGLRAESVPDFRVADLNNRVRREQDWHDYLSPLPMNADIVAICCIPLFGGSDPERVDASRVISRFGNDIDRWRDRIAANRPLLAVSLECFRDNEEVSVWDACPTDYEKLFASRIDLFVPHQPGEYIAHGIARRDVADRIAGGIKLNARDMRLAL